MIQYQVDICILNTIVMLANVGPLIRSRVGGIGNCWGVYPDCYKDVIYILNDAMNLQPMEVKKMLVLVSLPHVLSNKF